MRCKITRSNENQYRICKLALTLNVSYFVIISSFIHLNRNPWRCGGILYWTNRCLHVVTGLLLNRQIAAATICHIEIKYKANCLVFCISHVDENRVVTNRPSVIYIFPLRDSSKLYKSCCFIFLILFSFEFCLILLLLFFFQKFGFNID